MSTQAATPDSPLSDLRAFKLFLARTPNPTDEECRQQIQALTPAALQALLSTPDSEGQTLPHLLIRKGMPDSLRHVVGCAVRQGWEIGGSNLMHHAQSTRADGNSAFGSYPPITVTNSLLQAGYSRTYEPRPAPAHTTALHDAAADGDTALVRALCAHAARLSISIDALQDADGQNPLHYACVHRQPAVVRFLLTSIELGDCQLPPPCSPDKPDRRGLRALQLAAGTGSTDTCDAVLHGKHPLEAWQAFCRGPNSPLDLILGAARGADFHHTRITTLQWLVAKALGRPLSDGESRALRQAATTLAGWNGCIEHYFSAGSPVRLGRPLPNFSVPPVAAPPATAATPPPPIPATSQFPTAAASGAVASLSGIF